MLKTNLFFFPSASAHDLTIETVCILCSVLDLHTHSLILKTSSVLADVDLFYGKTSGRAAGRRDGSFSV